MSRFVEVRVMVVAHVQVSDTDAAVHEAEVREEVRKNIQNTVMQAACCGSLNSDDVLGEVVRAYVREAQPVTSSRN